MQEETCILEHELVKQTSELKPEKGVYEIRQSRGANYSKVQDNIQEIKYCAQLIYNKYL